MRGHGNSRNPVKESAKKVKEADLGRIGVSRNYGTTYYMSDIHRDEIEFRAECVN